MLSAAVVALGLVLGGHFEAPRDLKFQGALLPESELDRAIREKPTFIPSAIVLSVGAVLSPFSIALFLRATGGTLAIWGSLVMGTFVGIVAGACLVAGLIMLIVTAVERARADELIERLKQRPPVPAPAPVMEPPPSGMNTPLGSALLARF